MITGLVPVLSAAPTPADTDDLRDPGTCNRPALARHETDPPTCGRSTTATRNASGCTSSCCWLALLIRITETTTGSTWNEIDAPLGPGDTADELGRCLACCPIRDRVDGLPGDLAGLQIGAVPKDLHRLDDMRDCRFGSHTAVGAVARSPHI